MHRDDQAEMAAVSPSDSAAVGARRRSCTSAAMLTTAPTVAMATAAMRPPRPLAEAGVGAVLVRGDCEPDGSDDVTGDGDQWQQQLLGLAARKTNA